MKNIATILLFFVCLPTVLGQSKQDQLKKAGQGCILLFYYADGCAACHEMSSELFAFSKESGFHVQPMSFNDKAIAPFKTYELDRGSPLATSIDFFPAVFLYNPAKNHVALLSFGKVSIDTLKKNIVKTYKEIA